jgi:hypothetical protein
MSVARGLLAAALVSTLAGPAHAEPQWRARGIVDLALVSSLEGRDLDRLTHGDSKFDPCRMRLFLDARSTPGPSRSRRAATLG